MTEMDRPWRRPGAVGYALRRITFDTRTRRAAGPFWEWNFATDTELTGPMALRLWVEARGADDVNLFAGVEKWRGGRYAPAAYQKGPGGRCTVQWGPDRPARLLVPVIAMGVSGS